MGMSGKNTWPVRIVFYLGLFGLLQAGCGPAPLQGANSLLKAAPSSAAASRTPALVGTPVPVPESSQPGAGEQQGGEGAVVAVTIVYDNYPYQAGLSTAWGFAAVVEYGDQLVLFDTGGSGSTLLANLAGLGFAPSDIEAVVLSHEHNDHTGGLQTLLHAGADPVIYIPPSFSPSFKNRFQTQAQVVESSAGTKVGERLYTTGEMAGPPPEQALVIDTPEGLVVITGCAHPGVEAMILEAKRQYKEDIYLVLGGFHLGSASDARINAIIKEFQRLGVRYIAPCHCTGDHALAVFRDAWGDAFLQVGVGAVIEIEFQ